MNKHIYNILIAEDEDIIRNGLVNSVPWDELGFFIYTARHGKKALEIFNTNKIDLIITDIKMPFISGIELLQEIRKENENIPVIILSGYDDFKYAQQALRLGASEYLLKPIIMDDFIPLLSKFHTLIENRFELKSRQENKKNDYSFLLKALNSDSDYTCFLPYFNPSSHYIFCKIQIINFKLSTLNEDYLHLLNLDELFYNQFKSIIKTYNMYCIDFQLGERILIISAETLAQLKNIISNIGLICTNSNDNVKCHSFFSSIKNTTQNIRDAYNELLNVCHYHYFNYTEGITLYDDFIKAQASVTTNTFFVANLEEIKSILISNDEKLISNWFLELEQFVLKKKIPNHIQSLMIASDIYHKLMSILDNACSISSQDFLSPETSYMLLLKQTTLNNMFKILSATAVDVSNIINYSEKQQFTDSFHVALSYISAHYCEIDFSLDEVSKQAGMGRCYLSGMFKQNMGKTFIEYVTELRMKKAVQLIKEPYNMIYEIADKIGYQNSTYFSTIFKKYYGISPKEYKKTITAHKSVKKSN